MTRSELESAVYRRLQKNTASVDTATQTRIRHFLNQRHRRIVSKYPKLRDTTATVASVAGTATYSVTAAKIYRVYEATNNRILEPITVEEYRRVSPDPSDVTGTPSHYALINHAAGVWTVALFPRPTEAISYIYDIASTVADFSADNSVPLIPDEFHYLLELGAAMDELGKQDDQRYGVWAEEYHQGLRDLAHWIAVQSMTAAGPRQWSSLGAWFPPGT